MKIDTIIISCLMMISLTNVAAEIPKSGRFIYGSGHQIHSVDLATKKTQVLYEFQYGRIVDSLNILDSSRLLLQVPNRTESEVVELDIKRGMDKKIIKGFAPVYMSKHNVLFFFDQQEDKKRVNLYMTSLIDPMGSRRLIDNGPYIVPGQVVPVSPDEVVFLSRKDAEEEHLWLYNIVKNQMKKLPIDDCRPLIWRATTGELMCEGAGRKFFTDLAGHLGGEFTIKHFNPTLYLPGSDLLFGTTRRLDVLTGEATDLWVYDWKSNKKSLFLKNAQMVRGALVWLQD